MKKVKTIVRAVSMVGGVGSEGEWGVGKGGDLAEIARRLEEVPCRAILQVWAIATIAQTLG
ncbi:hypothetical protein PN498_05540 [Oscillatoria sp. CS-180]|uniref:hypothetical protein n=1 Tax=Oscillatoria sp. CS-180 TaxID=3021720 RepID=UPI00233132AA|nr:hypothetical protein [Oscillatoria sp. CS-180]MDB9525441.1 hypothetical protein [Oscillatoria sp. CS-180]